MRKLIFNKPMDFFQRRAENQLLSVAEVCMEQTTEYQRARASLENYGVFASGTLGRSMRPLFREGKDVVIVRRCEHPPKKYDLVLYGRGEKCVLHRVIRKRGTLNLIRGDNTYHIEKIEDSEILGILMEFDRADKHHTVDECGYRIYSRIWTAIYPIRYAWVCFRSFCIRAVRKIIPKRRNNK